ncbi:uncharacterized protein PAC_01330 [Phialocephala subalpina]|uniref:BZIP domain-containing protein n=1 Tax=Phialocephala subalpina TaxID=576137 RepID=A0A1L7WF96_9HELO|nr:uncharacterized protein PAC_01330 [Phialocephala subalpina]
MTQLINPYNDYLVFSTSHMNDSFNSLHEQTYSDYYYQPPLPYQLDGESDWMSTVSSSSLSTPDHSPTTTSRIATLHNDFPSSWPIGPTNTPPSQSAKDLQKLNRRRKQNRESQRAFRQRKNRDLEHLAQALADLQSKHEKLLKCFVGLTAKVSAERLGDLAEDMNFLDEQIKQYNSCLGTDFKMNGGEDRDDLGEIEEFVILAG